MAGSLVLVAGGRLQFLLTCASPHAAGVSSNVVTCFPQGDNPNEQCRRGNSFMTQSPLEVTQHRFLHFVLIRSESLSLARVQAEEVGLHLSKQEVLKDL